jgi:phage repressor protein C with HTH and peptisase S24 domain
VDIWLCEIADMASDGAGRPMIDALLAVKPAGLSLNAWALRAGVNRTIFNDVKKRNNIRHDSLVKLLDAAGVSLADFEAGRSLVQTEVRSAGVQDSNREFPQVPVPALKLLGSAIGGEYQPGEGVDLIELQLGEVLDYLSRPAGLTNDKDAYALTVISDSMAPRFEPGERIAVSPRAPVSIGDDVIVQLRGGDPANAVEDGRTSEGSQEADRVVMVLVKRLVRRSAAFVELRQFNPDKILRVPAERIAAIHKVAGNLF